MMITTVPAKVDGIKLVKPSMLTY